MNPASLILLVVCALAQGPVPNKGPAPEAAPLGVLETFLGHLATADAHAAHQYVAPSTVRSGDPIAYRSPVDYKNFVKELKPWVRQEQQSREGKLETVAAAPKFRSYKLGTTRWENPNCLRVWVHFQGPDGGGDNDEVMLVKEGDRWYVADPIHIMR